MNYRHLLVLVVAALFVVPSVAVSAAIGSPDVDATLTDNRVSPGEDARLTVSLYNDAEIKSADVGAAYASFQSRITTARGVKVTMGSGDAPIDVESGPTAFGSLPDGGSAPASFDVSVSESASPGTYEVPVHIEYGYTSYISPADGNHDRETVNKTRTVTLRVRDEARFEVVDVESNARVGSTGNVVLEVENTGTDPATDTRVTLTSQNGDLTFGQTNSATRYVGEWERGETKRVKYRVRTAPTAGSQRYAFQVSTAFEDDDGSQKTGETRSVGVRTKPEQAFNVIGADHDLRVDDTGTVNVTLRNDGPITVRDATVALTSNDAAIRFGESNTATRYVGEWAPGETRSIAVDTTATASAETTEYALSTQVTYDDSEGDTEQSGTLSLGLRPEPERKFQAADLTSNLRVGEEGTLTGTITNSGDTTANDVVVMLDTDTQNISPLERESAIGDLGPGESASFAFDVEISDAAEAGARQFELHPEYRNSDNEVRRGEAIVTRQDVGPEVDVFDLETSNASIQTGSSGALTVDVTNAGEETVTDVSAELFADDPISVEDSEAFVKRIDPGETETVTFRLSAGGGATAKSYPVSLDFQYDDEDGDTLLSDTYRLPVTVTEGGNEGGTLQIVVAVVAVVLVAGGGYYWYTTRS